MAQSKSVRLVTEAALDVSQSTVLAPIKNDVAALKVLGGLNPGSVNDATSANLIKTPTSETAKALSGAIGASVDPVRKRDQNKVKRGAPGPLARAVFPSWVEFMPGVAVFWNGVRHHVEFNHESRKNSGGTRWYVDTDKGTAGSARGREVATLTDGVSSGQTVTALSVTALPSAMNSGDSITLVRGKNAQTFIASAVVEAGAVTVPVVSVVANADYPRATKTVWALRSVGATYTAMSDGDEIAMVSTGVVWKSQGFGQTTGVTTASKSVDIIALAGPVAFAAADKLAWTDSGTSNVYQAARTNVREVVDIAIHPDGVPLVRLTSISAVSSRPGSWYQDASGSGALYVRTFTGSAPDPSTLLALLPESQFQFITTGRTSSMRVYLDGISVIGGTQGVGIGNSTGPEKIIWTDVDCRFLHGGAGVVGGTKAAFNGLGANGKYSIVGIRRTTAYSGRDGNNYHAPVGGTVDAMAMEISCESYGHGLSADAKAETPTFNASTAHDGAKLLRWDCRYHDTYGAPVADVNTGTDVVNLDCDSYGSLAPDGSFYSQGFSAQQPGVRMITRNCRTFDVSTGVYCDPGSSHTVDENTELDTYAGPVTFA